MKNLLPKLKPWQWIGLALIGLVTAIHAFIGNGIPLDEEVQGLTKAKLTSPNQATISEVLAKVGGSLKTASADIRDRKERKDDSKPYYKTAIEASQCRAKWCRKDLVGTGVCHGGDNQAIADCLTAYLKEKIGTADFPLDEPSPKDSSMSGRELFCSTLDKAHDACMKLAKQ